MDLKEVITQKPQNKEKFKAKNLKNESRNFIIKTDTERLTAESIKDSISRRPYNK